MARFNNCESLSLYFDKNFGADETKICYIGLRGDFSEVTLTWNVSSFLITIAVTSTAARRQFTIKGHEMMAL